MSFSEFDIFEIKKLQNYKKQYTAEVKEKYWDTDMGLNKYRDQVKEFMKKIGVLCKNQDQKLVWLEKELDLLKSAVKNSDNAAVSHQIYDMMYLLFEIAADNDCDLNSEWARGQKKKEEKYYK